MRMPSLLALSVAATALLGTSAAMAGPIALGPGGFIATTDSSWENLTNAVGQTLHGILKVNQIDGASGTVYSYGSATTKVTGVFDAFKLQAVQDNGGGSFRLYFSGGNLKYYTSANDPYLNNTIVNSGTQNAGITAIQAGSEWLNFNAQNILTLASGVGGNNTNCASFATCQAFDNADISLYIDLQGTLNSFGFAGTSQVYLDLISGSGFTDLVQDGVINSFTNAVADASYQGNANTGQCAVYGPNTPWQVCGSNNLFAVAVPEPLTLSLFGAGLVGAASLRRRKAKKA